MQAIQLTTGFKPIYDVILDSHSKIEKRSNASSDVTGIATGFTDFDKLTTGLHEDQLIILGADLQWVRRHLLSTLPRMLLANLTSLWPYSFWKWVQRAC